MRTISVTALLILCACASQLPSEAPHYSYQIVHEYPHDRLAFTEGLFYLDGALYESTGLEGQSSVRRVKLETGEVLQNYLLPDSYFGEGIVNWKDQIFQLTWRTEVGFVYDLKTFDKKREFRYPGEGWALTQDGRRLIMDDGTPQIRFWNPESLKEMGRITVTDHGEPVSSLNELEWVEGEIYANIWGTSRIARIDPNTGKVTGWIDLSELEKSSGADVNSDSVLNGIPYDGQTHRVFVPGKGWPKVFEIRVVRAG